MEPELILPPKETDKPRMRTCEDCRHPLPLTEEYFHRDPYANDGFCPLCIKCRREYRKEKREPKLEREISKIKFAAMKAAIGGQAGPLVPSAEELGRMVIEQAGSAEQLVKDLQADYANSKEGSLMRVKCMEMRLKIVQKAGESRPVIPLDQLSDEEFDAALEAALKKAAINLEYDGPHAEEYDGQDAEEHPAVG